MKRRFLLGASALFLFGTQVLAAPAGPNHVRDVKVKASSVTDGAEIEVVGTQAPVYSVRATDAGKRLLIDLSSADVAAGVDSAITTQTGVLGGVLTQSFKTETGLMTRVTVALAKDATYRVSVDGDTLRVILTPKVIGAVDTTPAVVTGGTASTTAVSTPAASSGPPQVKDVKFERGPTRDRVVVTLSKLPHYTTTPLGGKLRLTLDGTKVPESLVRTLDATAYRGQVRSVSTFSEKGGATIIEIDRNGDAPGDVAVEDDKLVWSFDLPKGMASPITKSAVRKATTIAREEVPADEPKVTTNIHDGEEKTIGGEQAGVMQSISAQAAGKYQGRRIDLDLKDADIHNVLRLLADVGHVNIVTADDVSGSITIRMRNVPWDQALDVVLQAKGLGMVRQGNLIRVAPAATLQKERELRIAAAKQEMELAPLETRLIPVSYATADELQARAKDLLSPRGSIAVDERTNVLIARDLKGNLDHIEELVRSLDTQTPQVLVEARIVEATSRYLRDVGIQWGGDATFAQATGNPTGIAFPSSIGIAGGNYDQNTPTAGLSPFQRQIATPNFAVNLPAATGTGSGGALGLTFGSVDNAVNIGLRLSAAEASGLVRIVSSPRILTLDNRQARINQGTLIPFAQVSAQGVQTTFQEAKLQLLVTPHVTADGSVAMHVKINRDEPDFNQTSARGDPTILKREAETDLLVMDGHTAVIGGIYTRNTGRNLDQVPFFGDIPILGVLFQRRRASDTRNELVIFITPRIVNRAEALGR
jgi:type IV pilus assembly protein PilQ